MVKRATAPEAEWTVEDSVVEWLADDPKLLPVAQKIANGDEFEYGDDELAEWAVSVLWHIDRKSPDRPSNYWLSWFHGSPQQARQARERVDADALLGANWVQIRERLLDGWAEEQGR